MASVRLRPAPLIERRMFKHSDDTYISFVFFAGAVLSICSLAVSLRTVYLIRAGKTAGLSPLIVILLILAGLCVVSMAFNFHVGYKVCKNQDSEFAQVRAHCHCTTALIIWQRAQQMPRLLIIILLWY